MMIGLSIGIGSGGGAPVADTTDPTISGWAVDATGLVVTGTLSESGCTGGDGTPSQFTFGGCVAATTGTVVGIVGTTITVTPDAPILIDDTPTISFTVDNDPIIDASENALEDFAGVAVTNGSTVSHLGTPAVFVPLRLADVTIAANADAGVSDLTAATNAGSIGGTFTSLGTPYSLGPNGYGRLGFAALTADLLTSSEAPVDFKFLHDFTVDVDIWFTVQHVSSAAARVLYNTKATAGTGVGAGATIGTTTAGEIYFDAGNGSAEVAYAESDALTQLGTYDVCVQIRPAAANKVTFLVNGSVSGTPLTTLSATPSSSDPGTALQVGNVAYGLLSMPTIYTGANVLDGGDITSQWALMAATQSAGFVSPADFVANAAHNASHAHEFDASGIVNLLGPTIAAVGTPPGTATDADFGNRYVEDSPTGATYYTCDGEELGANGTNIPQYDVFYCLPDDTVNSKVMASRSKSDGHAEMRLGFLSTERAVYWRVTDADSEEGSQAGQLTSTTIPSLTLGNFFGSPRTFQVNYRRADTGRYTNISVSSPGASGTLTLDESTLYARRNAGVANEGFAGKRAFGIRGAGASCNFALWWLLVQMTETWF